MKQVLFVATVGGFVPQFEMNDVKILRKMGCKIHYVANFQNNMYSYDENVFDENDITVHNVNIEKSPFKIFKIRKAYKEIKAIIDREKIDVVHCHTPVGGLLGRLASSGSKRKPKVVYTAHGFHFFKGASMVNWCIYYVVERFLARKTDVIITINEEDYNNAGKFKLKKNGKVYKIPGVGLDLDRFKDVNHDNKYKGSCGNIFRIATVSELNKNKNHEVVIEAIKKLNRGDIYYTIYGRGEYEDYLGELIKELNLEKYVQLGGYISRPENVLKDVDCFVFPSLREGLGMAALEAMACGIPVIAYDNRGTREYMEDGHNGRVCYKDDAKLYAEAISQLADSEELRINMGKNARVTAERFGKEHAEDIMRLVYGTLISEV